MTLLECLNEFNDDEELIDLTETEKIPKKVSELKERLKNDIGNYWISRHKYDYGKNIKKSISCKFGNVFIQK